MSRWWIAEPLLLGSSNPDDAELRDWRAEGVDTLICLLDTTEQPTRYHVSTPASLGITRHEIPVRDFSAPSVHQLATFVALVDALPAESRAVVHCQGGVGRTGTFGAAYLIAHGRSVEDAVTEIRSRRPGAVETSGQEQSLVAFAERVTSGG